MRTQHLPKVTHDDQLQLVQSQRQRLAMLLPVSRG